MISDVSGWVKIWDGEGLKCLATIKEKNQILGVVPHTRKERFLTLGEDARMRLYDLNTEQIVTTFENSYSKDKMTGHDSKIFAAKWHPKNLNEFISGGWDDTVQFWDMRKPQSNRYFAGAHICGEGLDMDPHGELVLTCSYQPTNSCRLWNYATAQPFLVLGTENSKLYCGRYVGPKYIVTGSSDPGNMRVINLFNMSTVILHKTGALGVYCLDANSRGEKKESVLNSRLLLAAGDSLSEVDLKFMYS
ncbi:WD domain, G-beta repeat [Nesidiocoris tenuis]|uniref:WD domain, G-beta repeat n=1 Tax=Nesidiocoris tenuis TaxID=355587 RepID=A0ABN7B1N0_9HEMI|nr:WD domain, G-beta repeat [Nesidiocoris tenuis]